jgi:hypothetical protein
MGEGPADLAPQHEVADEREAHGFLHATPAISPTLAQNAALRRGGETRDNRRRLRPHFEMEEARMSVVAKIVIVGVAAALVAGCSSTRPRAQVDLMDRSRDIFLLLRYDANNDRQITKGEMEAGVKADYAKADANGDGKLSPDEVQAENQRRWNLEGPQSSPLMDWNQDGNVSVVEFGNAVHSLFTTCDKDTDNVVTVAELQAPRGDRPKPAPIQPQSPSQQPAPGPTPGGGGYPR